jgi:hypothetical protein
MVFLAFISVKSETSKFGRVNICQNLLASEFFAIIVKDVANNSFKIYLFIIIQEISIPNTPLA